MRMPERLGRLEARLAGRSADDSAVDALTFWTRINTYADRFPPIASEFDLAARMAMSAGEHFAWATRFEPDGADLATIAGMHGVVLPRHYTPGDERL